MNFIDEVAVWMYDILKIVLTGLCYFIAGMLILGLPLALIAVVFDYLL